MEWSSGAAVEEASECVIRSRAEEQGEMEIDCFWREGVPEIAKENLKEKRSGDRDSKGLCMGIEETAIGIRSETFSPFACLRFLGFGGEEARFWCFVWKMTCG